MKSYEIKEWLQTQIPSDQSAMQSTRKVIMKSLKLVQN
jgi:hypothetical protein